MPPDFGKSLLPADGRRDTAAYEEADTSTAANPTTDAHALATAKKKQKFGLTQLDKPGYGNEERMVFLNEGISTYNEVLRNLVEAACERLPKDDGALHKYKRGLLLHAAALQSALKFTREAEGKLFPKRDGNGGSEEEGGDHGEAGGGGDEEEKVVDGLRLESVEMT